MIRPQCRCSASSKIILPALSSGQIRQDNSGFVCLSAARPLCIEQHGENQNQNWTGQTGCAAFVTDTSVFSPFISQLHPFPSLCLYTKESTVPVSEIFPKHCKLGVSDAELLREALAPAVSAGGGGDALVNRWQNETHTLPSCCSHATSHLRAGHTYTSADEPDTWPPLYARTHVRAAREQAR